MKTLLVLLGVASGILMLSTVICGLWLRYSGKPIETSSLNFHLGIALLTVLVSVVTIVLAVANVARTAAS
jgi:uncharacterized membrane protein YdcZ (DUF606 family)